MANNRRCHTVGSVVGHLWVCNAHLWEHQSSALWACGVPLREPQASGARCESESEVFSHRVLLTRWRKLVISRIATPDNESDTDSSNPSVTSLDIWVCNGPLWEHLSSSLWARSVPRRNTRPREHAAYPNPRFLASWLFSLPRMIAKKLLYLRPKRQGL